MWRIASRSEYSDPPGIEVLEKSSRGGAGRKRWLTELNEFRVWRGTRSTRADLSSPSFFFLTSPLVLRDFSRPRWWMIWTSTTLKLRFHPISFVLLSLRFSSLRRILADFAPPPPFTVVRNLETSERSKKRQQECSSTFVFLHHRLVSSSTRRHSLTRVLALPYLAHQLINSPRPGKKLLVLDLDCKPVSSPPHHLLQSSRVSLPLQTPSSIRNRSLMAPSPPRNALVQLFTSFWNSSTLTTTS